MPTITKSRSGKSPVSRPKALTKPRPARSMPKAAIPRSAKISPILDADEIALENAIMAAAARSLAKQ